MSDATADSLLPTSGMAPSCSCRATSSARAPAAAMASNSSGALIERRPSSPSPRVTSDNLGARCPRLITCVAQRSSETSTVPVSGRQRAITSTGSDVSSQPRIVYTSGLDRTRGISNEGTISHGGRSVSPTRPTNAVIRSRGIA